MRRLLLAISLLSSLTSFANQSAEELAFEMTGFEITSENEVQLGLSFRGSLNMILSKEGFESEEEAAKFCLSNDAQLDTEFNVMLIATSGAAALNKVLEELISFDLPEASISGIISWTGKGENTVTMMYNGGGSQTEVAPLEEMNMALQNMRNDKEVKFKIPALCLANK